MNNLNVTEIKAFVPAKDFAVSKRFYTDLGFTMVSEGGGVAYFRLGLVGFLLQDYCVQALAENFMMHILVEDVEAWWQHVQSADLANKYGVKVFPLQDQVWGMRDFCLLDPSGVLWRIGQNVP
jgi:catechol 2,3-dioxygenase-like lactoylglutathione lyase family enzyme